MKPLLVERDFHLLSIPALDNNLTGFRTKQPASDVEPAGHWGRAFDDWDQAIEFPAGQCLQNFIGILFDFIGLQFLGRLGNLLSGSDIGRLCR